MAADNLLTTRQLIKRHRNPAAAFEASADPVTGRVEIKEGRLVLQRLTGVTLTPVEMMALSKKYGGDGKTLDYKRFLADQNLPVANNSGGGSDRPATAPAAASSSRAQTPRRQRAEAEVGRPAPTYLSQPGIDKEADTSVLEASQSRLLKFTSDDLNLVPLVDGRSPAPVVAKQSNMGAARQRTAIDSVGRGRDFVEHHAPVVGSDVPDLLASQTGYLDGPRGFSTTSGGSVTARMSDPMYHTGELTGPAGRANASASLANFMADTDKGLEAPAPGYLPVFPGEASARRAPRDEVVFHGGALSATGGVASYVTDPHAYTSAPPGYMSALPNAADPQMPRLAVYDPMHMHGQLLATGGVGSWNNDVEGYVQGLEAKRAVHADPQHHGGVFSETGGIVGFAADDKSWLQRVPLSAKQSVSSPHRRAASAGRERASQRASSAPRRRSVPDLLVNAPGEGDRTHYGEAELDAIVEAGSPRLHQFVAGSGEVDEEGRDFAATGKPITGVKRRTAEQVSNLVGVVPGAVVQRNQSIAGPITDVTGMHHKQLGTAFGARSPVAAQLAASPLAVFDVHRLAQVRKAMREALPEKQASAAAVLRSRLAHLDGDGDGLVTDNELLAGLGRVFTEVDAASVGMLVRYLKHKRASEKRKAVLAKANAAAAGSASASSSKEEAGEGTDSSRHSADSLAASGVPVLATTAAVDAALLPSMRSLGSTLVRGRAHSAGEVRELHEAATSTAGFGDGVSIADIAEWVLRQPGGLAEVPTSMSVAGQGGNLTAIPTRQTPEKERAGPGEAGSAKALNKRLSPPKNTLLATDSGAVAAALWDPTTPLQRGAGLPDDLRDPGKEPAYHVPIVNDDAASMFTSFTSTGKAKTSSYGEMHRRKVTHSMASDARRGDGSVIPAGVSFAHKRLQDTGEAEEGPPSDRTAWAVRNAKFEAFRAKWEGRHGAAAAKEMQLDAAEPVDGPTWARADPQPFKVLHLAKGAPVRPL